MNTHINKRRLKEPRYDRTYLGTTITAQNYKEILEKEGRDGINFHTKHLRAYLKGKKTFTHGFNRDEDGRAISSRVFRVESVLTKL